jgi:hypothetical protein
VVAVSLDMADSQTRHGRQVLEHGHRPDVGQVLAGLEQGHHVEHRAVTVGERVAGELEATPVPLADGLARCRLVLDATPSPDLIDADWVRSDGIVSSPGLPPGVTPAAATALGDRLVHEPLALGVAAMAVQALLG